MNKNHKKASSKSPVNAFRKRVLAVVSNIPKGQVMTYAMVAKKAGNAKASRAVGYYMSQNYDLKIPCHRVIRTDGKIGNYNRGGEKAKRALLKKEGAIF
jgi:O-6-methylguanine DNA methyltransferase